MPPTPMCAVLKRLSFEHATNTEDGKKETEAKVAVFFINFLLFILRVIFYNFLILIFLNHSGLSWS